MKKSAALSIVMAGLDPAIQYHTEFIGFFLDSPVKPGHDKLSFGRPRQLFHTLEGGNPCQQRTPVPSMFTMGSRLRGNGAAAGLQALDLVPTAGFGINAVQLAIAAPLSGAMGERRRL